MTKAPDDGVALNSIEHPKATITMNSDADISPDALRRSWVEIDEKFIPTLEDRMARDKRLYYGDVVKILDIPHVWCGEGFVAACYGNNLTWPVQKEQHHGG